ncbi:MAG TPA: aldo/keto reductase [Candidatus Sulfotelmatobacter sp.]|nr:aldo/keto reductase [Candidatus Sulfotelmatobacter sp.]
MKSNEWNRREFIVKPILWAGAASVIGKAQPLFASSANDQPSPILQRTLGKTGITLPVVSMGVMNADIPGLLRRAYELGIRHFDTAAGYQQGRNEEMVGNVVKEMGVRHEVVISTKQASRNRPSNSAEAKARFIEGVESSLKRLQMDHVDILYHHAVDSVEDAQAEGPLEALQVLKKDGKTRFVGISTHKTQEVLNEAIRLNVFDVALVMLNYTMAHDAAMLATIERAAKSGMGIVAMKTQAGGTVRPDPKLPKALPAASQTALLKWALNHNFVTTAIPGFSTYEHLEQDFPVARNLAYTNEEEQFLADKSFAAQAEFCQQCGECRSECPKHVDIPVLMRSHMYAVQYRNTGLAQEMLTSVMPDHGLRACDGCESCRVMCRNTVQIARKIDELKAIAAGQMLL